MSLLLVFNCFLVSCGERDIKITGIYSNLSYVGDETGDIAGAEIILMQCGDSREYYLTFQEADGSPMVPVVIKPTIDNQSIKFEVPLKSYTEDGRELTEIIKYSGIIRESGIELEGESREAQTKWKMFLKRKKSFWQ
jgi:hypothetical protein